MYQATQQSTPSYGSTRKQNFEYNQIDDLKISQETEGFKLDCDGILWNFKKPVKGSAEVGDISMTTGIKSTTNHSVVDNTLKDGTTVKLQKCESVQQGAANILQHSPSDVQQQSCQSIQQSFTRLVPDTNLEHQQSQQQFQPIHSPFFMPYFQANPLQLTQHGFPITQQVSNTKPFDMFCNQYRNQQLGSNVPPVSGLQNFAMPQQILRDQTLGLLNSFSIQESLDIVGQYLKTIKKQKDYSKPEKLLKAISQINSNVIDIQKNIARGHYVRRGKPAGAKPTGTLQTPISKTSQKRPRQDYQDKDLKPSIQQLQKEPQQVENKQKCSEQHKNWHTNRLDAKLPVEPSIQRGTSTAKVFDLTQCIEQVQKDEVLKKGREQQLLYQAHLYQVQQQGLYQMQQLVNQKKDIELGQQYDTAKNDHNLKFKVKATGERSRRQAQGKDTLSKIDVQGYVCKANNDENHYFDHSINNTDNNNYNNNNNNSDNNNNNSNNDIYNNNDDIYNNNDINNNSNYNSNNNSKIINNNCNNFETDNNDHVYNKNICNKIVTISNNIENDSESDEECELGFNKLQKLVQDDKFLNDIDSMDFACEGVWQW